VATNFIVFSLSLFFYALLFFSLKGLSQGRDDDDDDDVNDEDDDVSDDNDDGNDNGIFFGKENENCSELSEMVRNVIK
jgi:hypothetical protein